MLLLGSHFTLTQSMNVHVANIDENKALLLCIKSGNKDVITEEKLELKTKTKTKAATEKTTCTLVHRKEKTPYNNNKRYAVNAHILASL